MKRLERLEKHGWRIVTDMKSGNVFAKRHLVTKKASSITALHKKIFGY